MFWREVFPTKKKDTFLHNGVTDARCLTASCSFCFDLAWRWGNILSYHFFFIVFIFVFCLAVNCIPYIKSHPRGYSFALSHFVFLFVAHLCCSVPKRQRCWEGGRECYYHYYYFIAPGIHDFSLNYELINVTPCLKDSGVGDGFVNAACCRGLHQPPTPSLRAVTKLSFHFIASSLTHASSTSA